MVLYLDDDLLDPTGDVTVVKPDGDYYLSKDFYATPITVTRAATLGPKRGKRIIRGQTRGGLRLHLPWKFGLAFDSTSPANLVMQGWAISEGHIVMRQPDLTYWHCDHQDDPSAWSAKGNYVTLTIIGTSGNTFVDVISGGPPPGGWVGKYLQCGGYSLGRDNRKAPLIGSTSVVSGRTRLQLTSTASYSGIPNNQVQSGGSNKTAQSGSSPRTNNYLGPECIRLMGGHTKSLRIGLYGSDLHNCSTCVIADRSKSFYIIGSRLYDNKEPPFDPTDGIHSNAYSCQDDAGNADGGVPDNKVEDSYLEGRVNISDTDDTSGVATTARSEPKWRNVWHYHEGQASLQFKAYAGSGSSQRGVVGYLEDVVAWGWGSGAPRVDSQRADAGGAISQDFTAPWNSFARLQVEEASIQRRGPNASDGPAGGAEINSPNNPALMWRARWDWLDLEEYFGWGTTVGVPSAPTAVTLAQGANAGELVVSWQSPTSDGGRPITSYLVDIGVNPATTGAGGPSTKLATQRSHTYTGLTPATTYKAQVRAVNDQGNSTAAVSGTANPPAGSGSTKPGVPTNVRLIQGDKQLTVTWGVPASDGGSAITGYTVRIVPPDTLTSLGSTVRQFLFDTLTNGQQYTVEVTAVNAKGNSDVVSKTAAPLEPPVAEDVELLLEAEAMEWTKTSHLMVFRGEVYERNGTVETLKASTYGSPRFYVTEGAVRAQRQSKISRTFDLTLAGVPGDIVPTEDVHLIDPLYRPLIKLARGVRYYSDIKHLYRDYFWSLGTFVISRCRVSTDDRGATTVSISGDDRSVLISANKWDVPYNIEGSPTYDEAILQLLQDRTAGLFDAKFSFETSANICPEMTFDTTEDPWEQAQKLAEADGKELLIDAEDIITLRTVPDGKTGSTFWKFTDKPGDPMMPGGDRDIDMEDAYNGVIMRGTAPWLLFELVGTAWDDDPTSPTYYQGRMGKKPKEMEDAMVGTQTQVDEAARKQLPNFLGVTETVSFQGIVNPAIQPGVTVAIVSSRLGIDGRGIVEEVEIPVTVKSGMSLTTRRQRRA